MTDTPRPRRHGRIQWDGERLDELVVGPVTAHLERMSHHGWWLSLTSTHNPDDSVDLWWSATGEPAVEDDYGPLRVIRREPPDYPCPHVWTSDDPAAEHQCEVDNAHARHVCECGAEHVN